MLGEQLAGRGSPAAVPVVLSAKVSARMSHTCPFCHVPLAAGVVVDRISGSNTRPIWIPEPAVESWFGGLREPLGPEIFVSSERCPTCGYLASFANPRPVP